MSKSFRRSKYDDYDFVEENVKKFDHRRRKRKEKDHIRVIDQQEKEQDAELHSTK